MADIEAFPQKGVRSADGSEYEVASDANLLAVATSLGDSGDAVATTDTGSFSLVALTKRLLTKLPLVSFCVATDSNGNYIDSVVTTGTGTNVGDILWSVDTTSAKSIYFEYPAVGSGMSTQLEASMDGVNWKAIPLYQLNSPSTPTTGISGPSGGHFGANTLGYTSVRMRVTVASTGGAVTCIVRTSSVLVPTNQAIARLAGFRILPTTAINGAAAATTRSVVLLNGHIKNTTTSDRYLHFSSSGTVVVGTTTPVWTVPLDPSKTTTFTFPEGGLPMGGGINWWVTTDMASATLATAGDVVGTIGYSGQ